jgi:putative copper resistance protein D
MTSSPARAIRRPDDGWPRFAGVASGAGAFALLLTGAAVVAVIVGTAVTSPAPVPGLIEPSPVVVWGIPVARLLLDVGAVTAAGLALLPKLVGFDQPRRTEPVLASSRRAAVVASGVWAFGALASIVLLTAELNPGAAVTPAAVWSYIGAVAAGKGLLVSAICALVSLWLARLAMRHGENVPAELRVGVALFGLLPLPLTGHASNWYYHDLSMISMELHVVAASAWAGGLAAVIVFLSRHRDLLVVALPKFSRLATWCVFVVGISGLFNGLLELYLSPITTMPSSLVTTPYGVMLLVKMACLAGVAVIALVVRTRLLPKVVAGRRTALAVWCGWELTILAVAFGAAVVLTRATVTPF